MKYKIAKISEANYKALKSLARDEGLSVSVLLNEIIREYVEEDETEE